MIKEKNLEINLLLLNEFCHFLLLILLATEFRYIILNGWGFMEPY